MLNIGRRLETERMYLLMENDYPQGTVAPGAGRKSPQSQHLPVCLQKKRCGTKREIQRQVCAVRHHGLRGMRAAIDSVVEVLFSKLNETSICTLFAADFQKMLAPAILIAGDHADYLKPLKIICRLFLTKIRRVFRLIIINWYAFYCCQCLYYADHIDK